MMFWVSGHPVIPFTAPHRIAPYHFICRPASMTANILCPGDWTYTLGDGIVCGIRSHQSDVFTMFVRSELSTIGFRLVLCVTLSLWYAVLRCVGLLRSESS